MTFEINTINFTQIWGKAFLVYLGIIIFAVFLKTESGALVKIFKR